MLPLLLVAVLLASESDAPAADPVMQLCIQNELTERECSILVKGVEWREAAVQRAHQLAQCEESLSLVNKDEGIPWTHYLLIASLAVGAGFLVGIAR